MNDGPKIEELSGTRVRIVKTGTAVNKVDNFLTATRNINSGGNWTGIVRFPLKKRVNGQGDDAKSNQSHVYNMGTDELVNVRYTNDVFIRKMFEDYGNHKHNKILQ
jgi:hypothetical protein